MWRIIIFAACLLVSGQFVQLKELTLKPDNEPSLIMFDSEQLLGEKPQSLTPAIPQKTENESAITTTPTQSSVLTTDENSPHPTMETKETRHLITFDQRQEGQYNIRADLDNFMIVVIPPNPSAGVNLLDLLTRSTLKRSNLKKQNKKHFLDSGKFNRQSLGFLKSSQQQQQQNYLNRSPYQIQPSQTVPSRFTDFIEGRTPYRVDISSNAGDNINSADLNGNIYSTDTQIDVIPPPIPSNYHQLMKPYHLELEPSIIHHEPQSQISQQQKQQQQQQQQQSSQPTVLIPSLSQGFFSPNQGNLMDLLNRASGGRFSKSIKSQYEKNSIRILNSNGLNTGGGSGNDDFNNYIQRYNNKRDIEYYPYYMGIANDAIYPPLSYDSINFNEYNKKLDDPDVNDILGVNNNNNGSDDNISTPSDNWEFKLIGAAEQCGPDRVRDSYGVCQFIKNI